MMPTCTVRRASRYRSQAFVTFICNTLGKASQPAEYLNSQDR